MSAEIHRQTTKCCLVAPDSAVLSCVNFLQAVAHIMLHLYSTITPSSMINAEDCPRRILRRKTTRSHAPPSSAERFSVDVEERARKLWARSKWYCGSRSPWDEPLFLCLCDCFLSVCTHIPLVEEPIVFPASWSRSSTGYHGHYSYQRCLHNDQWLRYASERSRSWSGNKGSRKKEQWACYRCDAPSYMSRQFCEGWTVTERCLDCSAALLVEAEASRRSPPRRVFRKWERRAKCKRE